MGELITARKAVRVDLPWIDDGRYYDLVSGRGSEQTQLAKSPWAFACMNIRGQELANLPWHIMKGEKIVESHPLIEMLTDFGPESNYQKGLCATEIDMLSYGAGYWFRDIDILKRLNPAKMKVNKTAAGISSFTFDKGGKNEQTFSRDEITYFREYHPEDDLGPGVAVMEVCKKSVNAEIEALLMVEAYFKNDAVPGFILTTDQEVSEKEANRVLAWWNARFRGSRNKGKVGVAGRGLKPTIVGSSMKDNALVEILDSARNDICVAMRVPKVLVGSMSDATYVNLSESRKFLIEDVIVPRAIEYQNIINQDLVNQVDPSVEFKFSWDELQILQEDSTLKEARLASMFSQGIISPEYYREEMGIEESAKGDEIDKAKVAEDKWERKAVKAVLRGDKADVPFETDNISIDRQHLIAARLSNAKTVEEAKRAFV